MDGRAFGFSGEGKGLRLSARLTLTITVFLLFRYGNVVVAPPENSSFTVTLYLRAWPVLARGKRANRGSAPPLVGSPLSRQNHLRESMKLRSNLPTEWSKYKEKI